MPFRLFEWESSLAPLCAPYPQTVGWLNLSFDYTTFLVRRSSDIQALSIGFPASGNDAIMFSSGLIERLSDDEIAFVVGHEIAHIYFDHHLSDAFDESDQGIRRIRQLALKRAAEISADRVGLIASRNVNVATSALIKTVTGLDEANVRFDIQAFLQQYKRILEIGPNPIEAASSHPLFLVRIRALLHFTRSIEFADLIGADVDGRTVLSEVDLSITNDLRRISGLDVQDIEDNLVQRALILAAFLVFSADGKLSKDEQEFLKSSLGNIEFGDVLEIVKERGMNGLSYEFQIAMKDFANASAKTQARITTFLQELMRSFPSEHTGFLAEAVSKTAFSGFI